MSSVAALLDASRRALNAQSQALSTIGENISNVNTPGYSRRRVELVSTTVSGIDGLLSGSGVDVERVSRAVDPFLNKELQNRISDRAYADIRQEYLHRAEQGFKLTNEPGSIGYAMNQFFSSLEDLANNPADYPLRSQVVQKGQFLVSSINDTYALVSKMQREADDRIGDLVGEVNILSTQIADLNKQIAKGETVDQQNLSLRDQRDQLVRSLAEIIPVNVVSIDERQILVSLNGGFSIVNGTNSTDLSFDRTPSFGTYPPGLDGNALGSVVHDFDATAGESEVDFTSDLYAEQGGKIGALLRIRGVQTTSDTSSYDATGDLVDIGTRVEAITRDLLTRFNQTYLGYDTAAGRTDENPATVPVDPYSGGLDGTSPSAYGLFSFTGAVDSDSNGLPDDLTAIGEDNYSSILTFNVTDEQKLAAALDLNPADGATSFAPGDASNLTNLFALRSETVNYSLGNFTANNITIEGLYANVAGYTGSIASQANSDYNVKFAREEQAKQLQSSATGVNLDEELANMINYQRAFQAAARLVKLGDDLLGQIVGLLG